MAAFQGLTGLIRGTGGHKGARSDRKSMRDWNPLAQSADSDNVPDLPYLRARSRDLIRNAPLATGAIKTQVTSVIGSGLRHQSKIDREILGMDDAKAAAWERRTERLFSLWCAECDITREQAFGELTGLSWRSVLESGDVLAIRRQQTRPGSLFSTRIQLVEADRIATPPEMACLPNVIDGVELDRDGAPRRYHVRNFYDHDFRWLNSGVPEWSQVSTFGEKGDRIALHLFFREREGQHRGVPFLAPVVEAFKQLDRYTEAELMAAVVSAFFTIVISTEEAEGLANETEDAEIPRTNAKLAEDEIQLGPGKVIELGVNEKANGFNPGRPNPAFDAFVMSVLRQMGTALEMPFETLIKHFTASYSASRAAIMEAWRAYHVRRKWMADRFCQPVYEWFLIEAVARGMIAAPGFFQDPIRRAAWCGATWTGRPQGMLDPVKEVDSAVARIENHLAPSAKVIAELEGDDWEQTITQLAREERFIAESGLAKPAATPQTGAPEPPPDDEKGDAEKGEDETREGNEDE